MGSPRRQRDQVAEPRATGDLPRPWWGCPSFRVLVAGASFALLWRALLAVHYHFGWGWMTGAVVSFLPGSLAGVAVCTGSGRGGKADALTAAVYGCFFVLLGVTRFLNGFDAVRFHWGAIITNMAPPIILALNIADEAPQPAPEATSPGPLGLGQRRGRAR